MQNFDGHKSAPAKRKSPKLKPESKVYDTSDQEQLRQLLDISLQRLPSYNPGLERSNVEFFIEDRINELTDRKEQLEYLKRFESAKRK